MISVSDNFKEQAKSNVRVELAKFQVKNTDIVCDENYLLDGFIQKSCYSEGNLIGNTIAKNLEFNVLASCVEDLGIDFFKDELVFYTGLVTNDENFKYEYVKHGTFIIDSVEYDEGKEQYAIKGMDYMIKANQEFIDDLAWKDNHYTILEFADYVCSKCDLILSTRNFPNSSYVLTEQPAFQGYQCRYVLGKIAEICGCNAIINENDELEFKLYNDTTESETIELESLIELKSSDITYKPYNAVVIALNEGVEGENATKRDEESIELYGERTLNIVGNEFAINESVRFELVNEIFDYINGFYYVPLSITYNSYDWLTLGDNIQVYFADGDENYYNSIVLNHTIEFPSTIKSTIQNDSESGVNNQYEYVEEQIQKNIHSEIMVDKLRGIIDEWVAEVSGFESRLSKVEQTSTDISTIITKSGGNNRIRNSVGFKGTDYWELSENAEVTTSQDTDTELTTISGSKFIMKNGIMRTDYTTIIDNTYTITFKLIKKNIGAANEVSVKLHRSDTDFDILYQNTKELNDWEEITYQYKATTNTPFITFDCGGDQLEITDFIVNDGEKQNWSQYFDEIYGKTHQLDASGLNFKAENSNESSHYDNNDIIFKDGDTKTAELSKERAYSDNGEFNNTVKIGNFTFSAIDDENMILY